VESRKWWLTSSVVVEVFHRIRCADDEVVLAYFCCLVCHRGKSLQWKAGGSYAAAAAFAWAAAAGAASAGRVATAAHVDGCCGLEILVGGSVVVELIEVLEWLGLETLDVWLMSEMDVGVEVVCRELI
jgi:hypothetical protein